LTGLTALTGFTSVPPNVIAVLLLLASTLALATVWRLWRARTDSRASQGTAWQSLTSWWALFALFVVAVALGRVGAACLLAAASALGLSEFSRQNVENSGARSTQLAAWLTVAWSYVCLGLNWRQAFLVGVPLLVGLAMPLRPVIAGEVKGFVRQVGGTCWMLVLLAYCLPHAGWLLTLESAAIPADVGVGLFVFVVILTQINDIAQALWGRRWGKHAVTPVVSPKKTWEGLLLGIATTLVVAVIAAPFLTPFMNAPPALVQSDAFQAGGVWTTLAGLPGIWAVLAGAVIAVGGFLGDVTMSAVKRDLGVKDSGTLLPGQGGMLDRIDSLTFTAPLFFYFVVWLYCPGD